MARDFNGKLTLAAATATNLLTLLKAQGFNSTPMAGEVTIKEAGADIYRGNSSAVTTANGELIAAGAADTERAAFPNFIDLTNIWLFSTPGTTFSIKVRGSR
jgi:hypothetical protein